MREMFYVCSLSAGRCAGLYRCAYKNLLTVVIGNFRAGWAGSPHHILANPQMAFFLKKKTQAPFILSQNVREVFTSAVRCVTGYHL